MTSFDAIIEHMEGSMRTTLAIDDDLVITAQELTGVAEKTALVRAALRALIERESARRLAALGGIAPDFPDIPRRKVSQDDSRGHKRLD
jgi:Arc/MetJ family transcription regulator